MLELQGLACVRGERRLFSGVSAQFAPGTLVRIGGDNGTGKTSLLRLVAGLSEPAVGKVLWRGKDSRQERDEFQAQLVFLGHASGIKDELDPVENLLASCALSGEPVAESAARSALRDMGLGERLDLEAKVLSAGQRRRVALARLLVTRKPLWLLDEPFNALDVRAVERLAATISLHLAADGICVYTTHQPVTISAPHSAELVLGRAA